MTDQRTSPGIPLSAEEVRVWRKMAGMSQPEFAAMLGLSRPTIARIEGGKLAAPKWMRLARDGWERHEEYVDVARTAMG